MRREAFRKLRKVKKIVYCTLWQRKTDPDDLFVLSDMYYVAMLFLLAAECNQQRFMAVPVCRFCRYHPFYRQVCDREGERHATPYTLRGTRVERVKPRRHLRCRRRETRAARPRTECLLPTLPSSHYKSPLSIMRNAKTRDFFQVW